jgi:hypothetical protein
MGRRVPVRLGPLISYPPVGLGGRGPRIIETHAVCSRCGHETWAPGAEHGSKMSALVMLRLSCPRKEVNFYTEAFPLPRARLEAGLMGGGAPMCRLGGQRPVASRRNGV